MNATATKGVWSEQLTPKITMICDTNNNIVRVVNKEPKKPGLKYEFPDGIPTSEVERIRSGVLRSLGIRD